MIKTITNAADLGEQFKAELDQLFKGKQHLLLCIGTLRDGVIRTARFDEKQNPQDGQVIYPVGSIAKSFTASLLAKEIADGRISLQDHLDRYVEGLPEGYYPTILRLATHHSGYGGAPYTTLQTLGFLARMNKPDGLLHINPFRGYPDENKMIEILKAKRLEDKDYKFEYSNLAFGVLGYILGKLQEGDYYSAMTDYIRNDLQLTDTSLENSDMTGYDKKENPCKPWQWERSDIIAPAGALLASMEDLLRFAQMNMDGSRPYMEMCHRAHAGGEKDFDQGLAWRLKKGTAISYHVGNAGAFSCMLALDRQKKTAVAVGMNYALAEIEKPTFAMLDKL